MTHNHFTHVMERLFRRILGLPKHPALAFMQVRHRSQQLRAMGKSPRPKPKA